MAGPEGQGVTLEFMKAQFAKVHDKIEKVTEEIAKMNRKNDARFEVTQAKALNLYLFSRAYAHGADEEDRAARPIRWFPHINAAGRISLLSAVQLTSLHEIT